MLVLAGSAVLVAVLLLIGAPGMSARPSWIVAAFWCLLFYWMFVNAPVARAVLLGWNILVLFAFALYSPSPTLWGSALFGVAVLLQVVVLSTEAIRGRWH
jgi:hypothetical protein